MEILDKETYDKLKKTIISWKKQAKTDFIAALARLRSYKITKEYQSQLTEIINKVHKQLMKELSRDVGDQLDKILEVKKLLKENQSNLNKQKDQQKKIQKKVSVQIPQHLGKNLPAHRKQYLKYLYSTFLTNVDEQVKQHKNLEPFLGKLQQQVYKLQQGIETRIAKHLASMKLNLQSANSIVAKKLMLQGKISAAVVSQNKTITYQIKKVSTVEEEKAEVLDGKGEECPKCRQKQALCYHMQQIRGADQPMTRFMRCKACKQTWNDQ